MMIATPYYLLDKRALLARMQRIAALRQASGARALLALKCFATWSVFDVMRPHMDGTTSSSLNEVRLGREQFGGETHAYSVAYADADIAQVAACADKIIFNSISQLTRFAPQVGNIPKGLRLNPGVSSSAYLLADPARAHSRLGETDATKVERVIDQIDGFMVHNHCENRSVERFDEILTQVEARFGHLFKQVRWVSLGGGIHFSAPDYPLDVLAARLKKFAQTHDVQVYLEPGEAAITDTATLEVRVLDIVENGGRQLAIVDASIEAHMLDLLTYQLPARIAVTDAAKNAGENATPHTYTVCGNSCLAGDIFGEMRTTQPLQVGDRLSIQDAAGYTMVKKNWFNGVAMPAIAVRELDGTVHVVRSFGYDDYRASLS